MAMNTVDTVYTVKLPDVGEGIAQAEIVAWRVAVGDPIREDEVIAEIMTDKATVELPSPIDGVISWLGGEVGDILSVGADLLRIETSVAAPAPFATPATPATFATPASAPVVSDTERGMSSGQHVRGQAAPAVRERARRMAVDLASLRGTGPGGRIVHQDLDEAILKRRDFNRGAQSLNESREVVPAPTNIDTVAQRSSNMLASPGASPKPDAAVSQGQPLSSERLAVAEAHPIDRDAAPGIERIKIIGLRRNIAERMQLSKRRIPHFTYVEEVDVTELERLRQQLNVSFRDHSSAPLNEQVSGPLGNTAGNTADDQWSRRIKLTVLPFIMRAVVKAIASHPQMNARFDDDAGVLERYSDVRLGIAVQTSKGLMVPVVKGMRTLDLWESAAEVARLSELARTSKIKIEDLVGSTITVTSLGTLGGIVSTPVINYPEVAVIGVNKIVERPVYVEGQLVPRKIMNLSSSFDHRVIDGADAAAFIQFIKGLLETPALLFVETGPDR